jgi:hypothetical protein
MALICSRQPPPTTHHTENMSPTKRSPVDKDKTCNKKSKSASTVNRYTGWTVPSQNYELPTINIGDITPRQFYENYVRARRPIIIKGIPADASTVQSWNSIEYLDKKAGKQSVMVERRDSTAEGYGKGNEVSMAFSDFLKLIKDGDEMHYLTTQDVQSNEDGRPDILPEFMKALSDDFPLRPELMGNLVPQNINLWMGNNNNQSGSSSGLHHDYHDNLYIVVQGRKRFRLFSPIDTQHLYTRGTLRKVHPNGRINYEGEETTAYGADLGAHDAAMAAARQKKAEERLQQAEKAVDEGRDGAEQELADAEEELEMAMDELIDAEADEYGDGETTAAYDANGPRLVDKTVKNPDNFSKIPADMLDDITKPNEEHPNLRNATMAYCNINTGEMLFLPASWFHEVTSYSVEGDGHHLALNYWCVSLFYIPFLCCHSQFI